MDQKNSKIAEHHYGLFQIIEIYEIEMRLVCFSSQVKVLGSNLKQAAPS